jgi:hypothetical protein
MAPNPTPFVAQRKSARNLVLSPFVQAAYGGALADASLTRRQRFDGSAIFEQSQTRRTDKDMAGKGTVFATDGQVIGWDSKFDFKAELDDWLAGWAFALAMGKEVVTAAAGGVAPFSHAVAFDETTTEAPATTLYLEDTAAVKYKALDMALNDLTLTIPGRGACGIELSLLGTGRWTAGAMAGGPPAIAAYNYILGSDSAFSIGAAGAAAEITGRHMSTTLKISNACINHVAPGGGLYGVFVRRGIPTFSIQTTIMAKETDDILTLFENDTLSDLKWVINSGASAQLNLEVAHAKLKTTKLGIDGNSVVWQIECDDSSSYAQAGAPALAVTVVTATPAYLAAA